MSRPSLAMLSFAAILALSAPALAEEKAGKVHRLMELMETNKIATQMFETIWLQFVGQMQVKNPNIPREAITSLRDTGLAEFQSTFPAFREQIEKIYELNLSDAELDAMVEFYDSPIGRSTIAKMPVITAQTLAVSQAFGNQMAPKVIGKALEALQRKGYQPKL